MFVTDLLYCVFSAFIAVSDTCERRMKTDSRCRCINYNIDFIQYRLYWGSSWGRNFYLCSTDTKNKMNICEDIRYIRGRLRLCIKMYSYYYNQNSIFIEIPKNKFIFPNVKPKFKEVFPEITCCNYVTCLIIN